MPLGVKALRPADAREQADGTFRRPVTRYNPDGTTYLAEIAVCEGCWEKIPEYVQAPSGWVSPASNSKLKVGAVNNFAAVEARQKVVCYDCYKYDALEVHGVFADFPHEIRGEVVAPAAPVVPPPNETIVGSIKPIAPPQEPLPDVDMTQPVPPPQLEPDKVGGL